MGVPVDVGCGQGGESVLLDGGRLRDGGLYGHLVLLLVVLPTALAVLAAQSIWANHSRMPGSPGRRGRQKGRAGGRRSPSWVRPADRGLRARLRSPPVLPVPLPPSWSPTAYHHGGGPPPVPPVPTTTAPATPPSLPRRSLAARDAAARLPFHAGGPPPAFRCVRYLPRPRVRASSREKPARRHTTPPGDLGCAPTPSTRATSSDAASRDAPRQHCAAICRLFFFFFTKRAAQMAGRAAARQPRRAVMPHHGGDGPRLCHQAAAPPSPAYRDCGGGEGGLSHPRAALVAGVTGVHQRGVFPHRGHLQAEAPAQSTETPRHWNHTTLPCMLLSF